MVSMIVGVLRRLLSDNNNEFSTFLLQTISEIREQLEPNTEHDFQAREEALLRMVHEIKLDIDDIDQQLMPLREYTGMDTQQVKDEIYELEKKKQVNVNKLGNL